LSPTFDFEKKHAEKVNSDLVASLMCRIASLLHFVLSTVIHLSDMHSSLIYLVALISHNCYFIYSLTSVMHSRQCFCRMEHWALITFVYSFKSEQKEKTYICNVFTPFLNYLQTSQTKTIHFDQSHCFWWSCASLKSNSEQNTF